MIHDTFCDLTTPCVIEKDGVEVPAPHHFSNDTQSYCTICQHSCSCGLLARVRADEQQKLIKRITEAPGLNYSNLMYRHVAIAAASQTGSPQ